MNLELKLFDGEAADAGVPAGIIGRIDDAEYGIKIDSVDVAPPSSDEIYRVVGK